MESALTLPDSQRSDLLADPKLRTALRRYFGTRVPSPDVDDLVQATLADALAAPSAPRESAELGKWVFGIARHKASDLFRARRREAPLEHLPEVEAEHPPLDARDLLHWAERELPKGAEDANTLEWMLREGDGEKLESIAASESLPAPRVRQRVVRLRRHFRARWAAELAAVLAVVAGALGFGLGKWLLHPRASEPEIVIVREPAPAPDIVRAQDLRKRALDQCRLAQFRDCIDGLDDAKKLDPAGDASNDVQAARSAANAALVAPAPPPSPSATLRVPPKSTAPVTTSPPPLPKPTKSSFPNKAKPVSSTGFGSGP